MTTLNDLLGISFAKSGEGHYTLWIRDRCFGYVEKRKGRTWYGADDTGDFQRTGFSTRDDAALAVYEWWKGNR